jgi:hypothetical protein
MDKWDRNREEVLMEVFDHKRSPVDVDLGFAVEETRGALCSSALSRATLKRQGFVAKQRLTSCIGAKNGSNAKSQIHLLPPVCFNGIAFSSGQVGLRSRSCLVPSHGTRGGEMVTANKAVHVCLRDERGLLPVPLASGCQALPSAAAAYTG